MHFSDLVRGKVRVSELKVIIFSDFEWRPGAFRVISFPFSLLHWELDELLVFEISPFSKRKITSSCEAVE